MYDSFYGLKMVAMARTLRSLIGRLLRRHQHTLSASGTCSVSKESAREVQTEWINSASIFADTGYRITGGMGHPRTSEKARNNSTSTGDIFWSCKTLVAQAFSNCGLARGLSFSSFSRARSRPERLISFFATN